MTSPNIVISQIYGGGGNSGATYTNDFIVLHNLSSSAVTMSGWSVQYASATGTTWAVTLLTNVTIQAGGYYLVQEAAGTGGTTPLPTPDVTGTIAMSGTAGKVALVMSTTALSGAFPTGAAILDFIGFGATANGFEGSGPAPAPSNTLADIRINGGNTDTDNNPTDFVTGAPTPQNSSTTPNPPMTSGATIGFSPTSFSITEGAAGTTTTAAFTVTRGGDTTAASTVSYATADGTATAGSDYVAASGTLSFAAGETSKTVNVTVNGDDVAEPNETFTLNLSNATGATISGGTATATILNDDVAVLAIHTIQGAGHTSPYAGQSVTTTGIVTAVDSNNKGYWIQAPDSAADADLNTSEAIHVFYNAALPTAVVVGDAVTVSGTVAEYRPSTNSLTQTEIEAPTTTVGTHNNALPTAIVIGAGGITPPGVNVGDNPNTGVFDRATQGSDFWESLEGMRVTIKDARATSPSGTVFITPNDPSNPSNTPRGGLVIADTTPGAPAANPAAHVYDFNPEAVQVFGSVNGVSAPTGVNVGDRLGDVTGIALTFNAPEILPTSAITVTPANLQRETTTISSAALDRISISGFNVENLSPIGTQYGDGSLTTTVAKFDGLAQAIITNLGTPNIIALEEIQDNNGTANDSVVAADLTLAQLIAAIVRAGGPQYTAIDVPPVDDQDGGAGGGNIRSAYLYLADRVTPTAANNLTTSQTMGTVSGTTVNATIQTFPTAARVGTGDPNFSSTRKPAPIEWAPAGFTDAAGGTFWTLNVHLTSKLGSQALYGTNLGPDSGPLFADNLDTGAFKREGQAIAVNAWAQSILANAKATDDRIVTLGDFNEFQFFPTTRIATGEITRTTTGSGNTPSTFAAGTKILTDMIETLPVNERYSYNFNGNAQALDQVLVSNGLVTSTLYDIVHINSEFASQLSDHDPSVTSLFLPRVAALATAGNDVIDQTAFSAKFGSAPSASLAGADYLFGLAGNDVISGGAGNDVIYGNQDNDVLYGNQDNDVLYGGQGNDVAYGGQGDDVVYGNLGDDQLFGNLGDDILNGADGINRLDGGDGMDTASYVDAGAGVTVSLLMTGPQSTGISVDTLISIENLTGGAYGDTLTGDANANVLIGNAGADVLSGGLGADVLYGNTDNDVLYGNQDNDVLYGGQGNDVLYGGQGNDVIAGGVGDDVLYGGLGDDTFVFEAGFGRDTLADWEPAGHDVIRFRAGTFANYADVQAHMAQAGSNVTLTLDTGNVITILGVTTAQLTADHFQFG